jgi:signal transduction histidine kinase
MPDSLRLSRRHRIAAYLMALALLTLVSVVFTLTSWSSAVKGLERELQTQAVMGSQAVDTYFVMMEKSLAELGRHVQAQGVGPTTWLRLAEYKKRFPELEIVVVNSPQGEILASSSPPRGGPNLNIGAEPSFALARDALAAGASMVVSRPFKGPVSKLWTAPLRYAVRDDKGRLQFLVGGGLSMDRTHEFWKDAPLLPGSGMGVVRDDTYVVARYPMLATLGPDVLFAKPAPGIIGDYLRSSERKPVYGVIHAQSPVTGESTFVAFRRLAHYPLTFFVAHPESHLRATWLALAWPTYALILLLFGGGMAIFGWIERRQAEWQSEREARVRELEVQTARQAAVNAELDALSKRQLASNLELKDLSTRLAGSNEKLEATNAEIEAFMYSVSHDLRAPIRAIDSYAAMLQASLVLPPDGEDHKLFARIRANAARMADLLNDLLELSRYSTQVMQKGQIDMQAEVAAVIAESAMQAAGARFETGELPACLGDRILIRQVWSNLITNALKYSAKNPAPVIRIGYENGMYFVADNGAGFDMAYIDKLFKLFSRLHHEREFEGTGIGLAIVKRIVERHGGTVGAEARPGEGARFFFRLPD